MFRVVLGTVVGAVIMFVWGMAAWMFLPLHDGTLHALPRDKEESVRATFKELKLDPGYYVSPAMSDMVEGLDEKQRKKYDEAAQKMHEEGPLLSIVVAEGGEMMPPEMMIKGFVINLFASLVVCLLLSGASSCTYIERVGFVFGMGLFAAVVSYVNLWNWMLFPLDFVFGMMADMVIGWTIAGIVLAAIIRPRKPETT